ncbi:MAG: NCS2 family permease, partial [Myxococcota bacterium]
VLGFPAELVLGTVLPGAALSILVGNVFYAWQSKRLAVTEGRDDVTALPYGINTVSLFAYVFLVMLPVKLAAEEGGASAEDAARIAWQVGLAACLVSGAIEAVGALVAEPIRRVTPRAALLSTLAGIAISFIAIDFAVRSFETPLVAMLPLAVILATFFGKEEMPLGVPGGAWAVALGSALAWILAAMGEPSPVSPDALASAAAIDVTVPLPVVGDLLAGFQHPLFAEFFVPVMLPMGLFNILGSLQNIESAEAAGDAYPAGPSLAVNGAGSVVAAVFGSCFPTTIYIGHPGWKALGARSGYSVANGVFFSLLAMLGLTGLLAALVPLEAGMAIVLWIGIVITAQAFQATPRSHAPAVAFGLFPAIAGWGVLILTQTLGAAGVATGNFALAEQVIAAPESFAAVGMHFPGLVALSMGFMLTCVVWAAASTMLIERRFRIAAAWLCVGALLSFFGLIHAGELTPAGGVPDIGWATGWRWSVGYLLGAAFFGFMHWSAKSGRDPETGSL